MPLQWPISGSISRSNAALFEPLRSPAARLHEFIEPAAQLLLIVIDGCHHTIARRHVVARRVHRERGIFWRIPPVSGSEELQRFDFIVEPIRCDRSSECSAGKTSMGVAANTKAAAREVHLVARVLHPDELRNHVALAHLVATAQSITMRW